MLFNVIGYSGQVIGQVEAEDAIGAWQEAGKKYENVLDVRAVSERMEALYDPRRTVSAANISGIIHRVINGHTFCGLPVRREELLLLLQRPEDITCPECRITVTPVEVVEKAGVEVILKGSLVVMDSEILTLIQQFKTKCELEYLAKPQLIASAVDGACSWAASMANMSSPDLEAAKASFKFLIPSALESREAWVKAMSQS